MKELDIYIQSAEETLNNFYILKTSIKVIVTICLSYLVYNSIKTREVWENAKYIFIIMIVWFGFLYMSQNIIDEIGNLNYLKEISDSGHDFEGDISQITLVDKNWNKYIFQYAEKSDTIYFVSKASLDEFVNIKVVSDEESKIIGITAQEDFHLANKLKYSGEERLIKLY